MAAPVRILLVSGSTRAGSTNTAVLRTAQAVAPDGVITALYAGLADLPAFNPDDRERTPTPRWPRYSATSALRSSRQPAHRLL